MNSFDQLKELVQKNPDVLKYLSQPDPRKQPKKQRKGTKKLNGKIRYTEYPEIGHDSWKAAYAEPDFLKWLFDQILE
jgi:hypothetical protein